MNEIDETIEPEYEDEITRAWKWIEENGGELPDE